ncbi:MAG: hypothetical protein WBA51_01220 [Erythrobacter sp.]
MPAGYIADVSSLPVDFPTHLHDPEVWEELGRTIATFGFLEETLGNAIFAFSATTEYSEEAIAEALEGWLGQLEKALTDTLGAKIDAYAKVVKANGKLKMDSFDKLIDDLREASRLRNVLSHGSWQVPNKDGASRVKFVNRKMLVFDSLMDAAFLKQTREAAAELAVHVINTVTVMGWRFPGSNGPGETIWKLASETRND